MSAVVLWLMNWNELTLDLDSVLPEAQVHSSRGRKPLVNGKYTTGQDNSSIPSSKVAMNPIDILTVGCFAIVWGTIVYMVSTYVSFSWNGHSKDQMIYAK